MNETTCIAQLIRNFDHFSFDISPQNPLLLGDKHHISITFTVFGQDTKFQFGDFVNASAITIDWLHDFVTRFAEELEDVTTYDTPNLRSDAALPTKEELIPALCSVHYTLGVMHHAEAQAEG